MIQMSKTLAHVVGRENVSVQVEKGIFFAFLIKSSYYPLFGETMYLLPVVDTNEGDVRGVAKVFWICFDT